MYGTVTTKKTSADSNHLVGINVTALILVALNLAGCIGRSSLTCDATHHCPRTQPQNGFSGMAQIDENNYLVVHDYKTFRTGWHARRLGIVTGAPITSARTVRYQYLDNEHHFDKHIEAWPDSTSSANKRAASDLESACTLRGHPRQFLVAESGSFDGRGGEIFHITLSPTLQEYTVSRNPTDLPGLDPNNGQRTSTVHSHTNNPSDENYEGLACWQATGANNNEYLVVLAERGATVPDTSRGPDVQERRTTGTLQWAYFDLGNKSFSWRTPINNITAPGMHTGGDPACWRDISGLHIDTDRRIWATAAYDRGDNCSHTPPPKDQNYSVIYQLGALCLSASDTVLAGGGCAGQSSYPTPVRLGTFSASAKIDNSKLEAISGVRNSRSGQFSIASEDEGSGSWWINR